MSATRPQHPFAAVTSGGGVSPTASLTLEDGMHLSGFAGADGNGNGSGSGSFETLDLNAICPPTSQLPPVDALLHSLHAHAASTNALLHPNSNPNPNPNASATPTAAASNAHAVRSTQHLFDTFLSAARPLSLPGGGVPSPASVPPVPLLPRANSSSATPKPTPAPASMRNAPPLNIKPNSPPTAMATTAAVAGAVTAPAKPTMALPTLVPQPNGPPALHFGGAASISPPNNLSRIGVTAAPATTLMSLSAPPLIPSPAAAGGKATSPYAGLTDRARLQSKRVSRKRKVESARSDSSSPQSGSAAPSANADAVPPLGEHWSPASNASIKTAETASGAAAAAAQAADADGDADVVAPAASTKAKAAAKAKAAKAAAAAAAAAGAGADDSDSDDGRALTPEEERKRKRRKSNRAAAQQSRLRKKLALVDLEQKVAALLAQNATLVKSLDSLKAENATLRKSLVTDDTQQTNEQMTDAVQLTTKQQPTPRQHQQQLQQQLQQSQVQFQQNRPPLQTQQQLRQNQNQNQQTQNQNQSRSIFQPHPQPSHQPQHQHQHQHQQHQRNNAQFQSLPAPPYPSPYASAQPQALRQALSVAVPSSSGAEQGMELADAGAMALGANTDDQQRMGTGSSGSSSSSSGSVIGAGGASPTGVPSRSSTSALHRRLLHVSSSTQGDTAVVDSSPQQPGVQQQTQQQMVAVRSPSTATMPSVAHAPSTPLPQPQQPLQRPQPQPQPMQLLRQSQSQSQSQSQARPQPMDTSTPAPTTSYRVSFSSRSLAKLERRDHARARTTQQQMVGVFFLCLTLSTASLRAAITGSSRLFTQPMQQTQPQLHFTPPHSHTNTQWGVDPPLTPPSNLNPRTPPPNSPNPWASLLKPASLWTTTSDSPQEREQKRRTTLRTKRKAQRRPLLLVPSVSPSVDSTPTRSSVRRTIWLNFRGTNLAACPNPNTPQLNASQNRYFASKQRPTPSLVTPHTPSTAHATPLSRHSGPPFVQLSVRINLVA